MLWKVLEMWLSQEQARSFNHYQINPVHFTSAPSGLPLSIVMIIITDTFQVEDMLIVNKDRLFLENVGAVRELSKVPLFPPVLKSSVTHLGDGQPWPPHRGAWVSHRPDDEAFQPRIGQVLQLPFHQLLYLPTQWKAPKRRRRWKRFPISVGSRRHSCPRVHHDTLPGCHGNTLYTPGDSKCSNGQSVIRDVFN